MKEERNFTTPSPISEGCHNEALQGDETDSTPSPEGGLRVLRCYKEHVIFSVACRGDAWGPKYKPKRRRSSSKDESYHQKTKYEGPQPTV